MGTAASCGAAWPGQGRMGAAAVEVSAVSPGGCAPTRAAGGTARIRADSDLPQCREHAFARERQRPDPGAGRPEHGVGDRRAGRRETEFADT